MIAYHGTTRRRALRIVQEGLLPKKPSRRVWFAESYRYAEGRAKTQARRAHDRPVVLTCEIDLSQLRGRLGGRRVFHRNRVIAIDAPVPVSVLRSDPTIDAPSTPRELSSWVNRLLGLKPHKGAQPNHPGILRLSRWVANRRDSQPGRDIQPAELARMARAWLGELFKDVEIDFDRLRAYRRMAVVEVKVKPEALAPDPREAQALELLEQANPRRRIRGLLLLAELGEPDLFDWCAMCLDDASPAVRVAALRTMVRCEDGDPQVIVPLAGSEDKRVRAAAIAALARHSGRRSPFWFERGLKDPSPCVRVATAGMLDRLDPARHRDIFELALYDPNPDVARRAEKLIAGKGYARRKW